MWPSSGPWRVRKIRGLIGELYAVERLVAGPFLGCDDADGLPAAPAGPVTPRFSIASGSGATGAGQLARSDFGKVVRYMLERWTSLTCFVDDARIPLDNNAAERALRAPVVGRKNHYGSRSVRAEVAAVFCTLCKTERLLGVDPHAHLLRRSLRRYRSTRHRDLS
jgi:transposase